MHLRQDDTLVDLGQEQDIAVEVLKGNRVQTHKVKSIDRNRYLRSGPTL